MRPWRTWLVPLSLCVSACQDFGAAPAEDPSQATNPDARVSVLVERSSYSAMDTILVAVRNNDVAPLYAWFGCQGLEKWVDGRWVSLPAFCWAPFQHPPELEELAAAEMRALSHIATQPGVYRAGFLCYDVPVDGLPRRYVSSSWTVQ